MSSWKGSLKKTCRVADYCDRQPLSDSPDMHYMECTQPSVSPPPLAARVQITDPAFAFTSSPNSDRHSVTEMRQNMFFFHIFSVPSAKPSINPIVSLEKYICVMLHSFRHKFGNLKTACNWQCIAVSYLTLQTIIQRLEAESAVSREAMHEESRRKEDGMTARHTAALKEAKKSEAKHAERFRVAGLAQVCLSCVWTPQAGHSTPKMNFDQRAIMWLLVPYHLHFPTKVLWNQNLRCTAPWLWRRDIFWVFRVPSLILILLLHDERDWLHLSSFPVQIYWNSGAQPVLMKAGSFQSQDDALVSTHPAYVHNR